MYNIANGQISIKLYIKLNYTFEYMYITRAYLLPRYTGNILKDQEENLI